MREDDWSVDLSEYECGDGDMVQLDMYGEPVEYYGPSFKQFELQEAESKAAVRREKLPNDYSDVFGYWSNEPATDE